MCGREVRGSHVEGFFLQLNGFANWTLPLKKVGIGQQAPTSVVLQIKKARNQHLRAVVLLVRITGTSAGY